MSALVAGVGVVVLVAAGDRDVVLWADEATYLSLAVEASGRAGDPDLTGMPTYSSGYSLVLTPVLSAVGGDPWRLAVVLNVLALGALTGAAYLLVRSVGLRHRHALAVAATASLAQGVVLQVGRAWPEVLLALLVTVWATVVVHASRGVPVAAGIAGPLGAAVYLVHGRAVAVAAVTAVALAVTVVRGRPAGRMPASIGSAGFLVVLVGGQLLDTALKQATSGIVSRADRTQRIRRGVTDPGAWDDVLVNLLGQLWAQQAATFGLAALGALGLWALWRHGRLPGAAAATIAAALVGSALVSALFLHRGKAEILVYERYLAVFVPVFVALGLAAVLLGVVGRARWIAAGAGTTVVCVGVVLASSKSLEGAVMKLLVPGLLSFDMLADGYGEPFTSRVDVEVVTLAALVCFGLIAGLLVRVPLVGVITAGVLSSALAVVAAHGSLGPFLRVFEGAGEVVAAAAEGAEASGVGSSERLGVLDPGLSPYSLAAAQYRLGWPATGRIPADDARCPAVGLVLAGPGAVPAFPATRLAEEELFPMVLWRVDCTPDRG